MRLRDAETVMCGMLWESCCDFLQWAATRCYGRRIEMNFLVVILTTC